jgi:hypothetical protein
MLSVHHLLLVLACVCFGLAALAVQTGTRVNLEALGLFCWSLTWFV